MTKKCLLTAVIFLLTVTAFPGQADEKAGRGRVKDFAFEFAASPGSLSVLPLKVCLLPVLNSNDVERHTRNTKKAFRNMDSDEYPRVLGFRYNAYGKPLNRFMTSKPFEGIVQDALEDELKTLGVTLIPSPTSDPPENFRRSTLLDIAENFSGEVPDVLLGVEIEDFFFETTPGFAKLKMETFFVLEVTVFDMKEKDVAWDGTVEAGELEKKAMFMGKTAVENRLNGAFGALIEGVLRENADLQAQLASLR